ncbi:MAG TPA: NADPH-dependent F420 reductase [Solirubrobacteraceae bacterium]|nr:NADPH-dependent F420 reductase [Solirubrobacteraceae bacterium]
MPEPVSIIGASGALGFGLALRLARAGCAVTIGSRDAERAEQAAARAREQVGDGRVAGLANEAAAAGSDVVILTVPFRSQAETLHNLREALRAGQLVVDATVPLAAAIGGRATRTLGVPQGSAAQQAQEMVPDGVSVVSALHTVSAAVLRDLDRAVDEDVLLCGDRRSGKRRVAALLEAIDGLRCVDCGRLEMARVTEAMTALMISVNARYRTHAGVRITRLPAELWPAAS